MYEDLVQHTATPPSLHRQGNTPGGITATGLGKRFGDLWALRHLDLRVEPGTVLGLLGHNGAGKTTAIRILTTLSLPTEGSATVAGVDVVRHPAAVRERIGVASQQSTVDGLMNARLNLVTIGRLHGMSKAAARQRADELLEMLDLTDFATALVKTYSGGMRRRLDLAASLMGNPEVLFLDEPTTGLDPRSRGDLWQMLTDLVREGTTIVLTTQYLEEADRMADDIVVLDHGRTVAHGTPAELKARIGDDRLDVKVAAPQELVAAASALSEFADNDPTFDSDELIVTAPIKQGVRVIDVVRALDEAGIEAVDITRRQATLDDVFLTLTSRGDDSTARTDQSSHTDRSVSA
jgi:ABC-2 type transport system ATP-binding protein